MFSSIKGTKQDDLNYMSNMVSGEIDTDAYNRMTERITVVEKTWLQDRKKLRRVEKLQKNCVKRTSRGLLNSVKERIWNSLQKMLSVLI